MVTRNKSTDRSYFAQTGRLHFAEVDQEIFVPDDRAGLRPSEVVQSKLLQLIPEMPVPVSCLHTCRDTRRAN